MRTLAASLGAHCGRLIVCGNWFHTNVTVHDSLDDLAGSVASIRYDGDPT